VGCNFFRWCFEDSVDERDAVIIRQRKRIYGLEKSVRVWKKRFQLSIVGMLFLVLVNIVLVICNFHGVFNRSLNVLPMV